MKTTFNSARKQNGAVLVVSLIMLGVMTLFVISMLKTSIIELKIGGASQVAALNFANAEVALTNFVGANSGLYAPGFLVNTVINTPPAVFGGAVAVTARQLNCGLANIPGNMMGPGGIQAVQFDVMATATGTLGGTARLHQGVESLAAPYSCP